MKKLSLTSQEDTIRMKLHCTMENVSRTAYQDEYTMNSDDLYTSCFRYLPID